MTISFPEICKHLRESKNLSQKDIAKIINVPSATYVYYEEGRREPPLKVLIDIAGYFGVSINALLGLSSVQPAEIELVDMDVIPVSSMRNAIENLEGHVRWLTDTYKKSCLSTVENVQKSNFKDMATKIPQKFEDLQKAYAKIQAFEEQIDLLEHIIKNHRISMPTTLTQIVKEEE